jgi:hypothetical protein
MTTDLGLGGDDAGERLMAEVGRLGWFLSRAGRVVEGMDRRAVFQEEAEATLAAARTTARGFLTILRESGPAPPGALEEVEAVRARAVRSVTRLGTVHRIAPLIYLIYAYAGRAEIARGIGWAESWRLREAGTDRTLAEEAIRAIANNLAGVARDEPDGAFLEETLYAAILGGAAEFWDELEQGGGS